ncbi:MAG: tryptophan synthase subunit alpha [Leptospirales bacterium]
MGNLQLSLSEYLNERKEKKGYVFVPYLTVADPDWEVSLNLVDALIESGADTIELGLPFTDPVADGPILQKVFKRVIEQGFTLEKFFNFLGKIKQKHPDFPLMVMGYANIFHRHGFSKILNKLHKLNVRGVVIPDVPIEEKLRLVKNENLSAILDKVAWIDFVTPTTTGDRLEAVGKQARGFIYFVSTKGVTGQSDFHIAPWKKLIRLTKQKSHTPVLIGFGIRKKEHVKEAIGVADGFIIGSRIHEIIEQNLKNPSRIIKDIKSEIKNLLPS